SLIGPRLDTRAGYSTLMSNSPSRTPPVKASHSAEVKVRTEPVGFLESRTPTLPSAAKATSTQLSPPLLRRDLRQLVNVLASITILSLSRAAIPAPRRRGSQGCPGRERGFLEALVQGQVATHVDGVGEDQVRGH